VKRFLFFIDHVSSYVGKTFAWSIVVLTFATAYDVFARYLFSAPTEWAYDAEYMLYGTLFMMAGAYALSRNSHVRGDVVYRLFPVRVQAGIDLVLYVIFFFPGILALVYAGSDFAKLSWVMDEHSANSPGGPPIYPFKMILPIAAFFLVWQGIAETIRAYQALRTGVWPQRLQDVEEMEKAILDEAQRGKKSEEILEEVHKGQL
jgi:TRAP-type mannitol/chloroaromatic compound transport system permease small subunit